MSNVEFSLKRFPVNGAFAVGHCHDSLVVRAVVAVSPHDLSQGKLKDECGLPFSCVIQPFSNSKTDKPSQATPDDGQLINSAFLARCAECYSYVVLHALPRCARYDGDCCCCLRYINGYCLFHSSGWECSLCGSHNHYQGHAFKRHAHLFPMQPGCRQSLLYLTCCLLRNICLACTCSKCTTCSCCVQTISMMLSCEHRTGQASYLAPLCSGCSAQQVWCGVVW
jgi:hypothetical protein